MKSAPVSSLNMTVTLTLLLIHLTRISCHKNDQWSRGLIEINEEVIPQFIESVDTALLYFHKDKMNDNAGRFLWYLEKAARNLHAQDYGVLIAKVNCSKSLSMEYCSNSDTNQNVYIFRNGRKIILSRDSLPDENAIAASLMHIDLIEKVPILKNVGERKHLEKKCLGVRDILLIYVPYLGGYEHRVFMEITYSFLDQYLCAMTTSLPVTDDLVKPPYAEEDASDAEREPLLWVLNCRNESNSCQKYPHRGAVHLDSVTRFLAAVQLPKLSEARVEGNELRSVYDEPEIDIPVLYVIYSAVDKNSAFKGAQYVSAVFRGSVGVALYSRDGTELDIHSLNKDWKRVVGNDRSPNFIFQEESRGQKWSFPTANGAVDFMKDYLEEKRKRDMEKLRAVKREDFFEEIIPQLIQDDPIALIVQQIGKPDLKVVVTLTEDSFVEFQNSKRELFVLYYLPWEPVSQLAIHMINAISKSLQIRLEDNADSLLAKIDCYDWTHFCQKKNVFTFPTLVLHRNTTDIFYRQIFEKSAMESFIVKHRGKTNKSVTTKFCDENETMEVKMNYIPEITIHTFHGLVQSGKPLAILIGNQIRQMNFEVLTTLMKKRRDLPVTFCFLNSGLGLGKKVARFYNLTYEENDTILYIDMNHLDVHKYEGEWTEMDIELWLEKVANREISTKLFKTNKKWPPLQKDFDFLSKIEEEAGEEKISMDADLSFGIFSEESIPSISKSVKGRRRPVSPVNQKSVHHKEL